MLHDNFSSIVQHGWSLPTWQTDKAKIITAKFKNLIRVLKAWHLQLSNLKATIANVKLVLSFLEMLEDCRDLSIQEWNFKEVLADKFFLCSSSRRFIANKRGQLNGLSLGMLGPNFSIQMPQLGTVKISLLP